MNDFPFLTRYDPPGTSEGTLDPLGLYLIADQLAMKFVPGVRERMLRIRFLTPMTVGALVTEGLEANPSHPETPPFLVWEWLVVEAIIRTFGKDPERWGLPGSMVTRRAITQYNYVDHRSYLKTPRVFGFHGVYKRLAVHLGLVDRYMRLCEPKGLRLIQSWSKDRGLGVFNPDHSVCISWRKAVESSLKQTPVKTTTHWSKDQWKMLAESFLPDKIKRHEKACLRGFLLNNADNSLGGFKDIWELCEETDDEKIDEKKAHRALMKRAPRHAVMLDAIDAYETFCRVLSDAFDLIRVMAKKSVEGFINLSQVDKDEDFVSLTAKVHRTYRHAVLHLEEVSADLDIKFKERFDQFSEAIPPTVFAIRLCNHHEEIQRIKSKEGKRPWFDRLGDRTIYVRRRDYRLSKRPEISEAYVHDYRTQPIFRFCRDLR